MDNIKSHLGSLRLDNDNESKKIGPAIPPKPKQPVVPKSYALNRPCEPSYTRPLQYEKKSPLRMPIYSNITPLPHVDKTGNERSKNNKNDGITYSNIQVTTDKKANPRVYSNINTYSNLPPYSTLVDHHDLLDDFPPPPPEPVDYSAIYPLPPDEFPSPPSPLSSSYSELRRATEFHSQPFQQDYGNYGPSSRSSSTYESIYEPINPRPSSEMSSRSNYSLYGSASTSGPQRSSSTQPHEEAEVDTLTDLLINSMDSTIPDPDTFGVCSKCAEKVVGEGSGCTAMGKVYHISCFTCCHCHTRLEGKPFFNLDGEPYCEQGYLETLEKCSVCFKPILDRILRATGRPYHPHCFTCVVCGKNLDGITFTIDATNQIHCIEDFHKKFAPRCCVCKQPIMPEPGEEETVRIVALDRSFHTACYKCEDCGLVLSTEAEGRGCYPLDDHILCKSCNAKRVQTLTSIMTTEL